MIFSWRRIVGGGSLILHDASSVAQLSLNGLEEFLQSKQELQFSRLSQLGMTVLVAERQTQADGWILELAMNVYELRIINEGGAYEFTVVRYEVSEDTNTVRILLRYTRVVRLIEVDSA